VMAPPPPPPPPPAAAMERDSGGVVAQEERLGEVRLYRVPIKVTVASRSQKQIALLRQPAVRVEQILTLRDYGGNFETPLQRVLVTHNRSAEGLGLPLPAGKVALFGQKDGRRILLGEGSIDDYTLNEKVEFKVGEAPGVRAKQTVDNGEGDTSFKLVVTNDMASAQTVEIELPLEARATGKKLVKRDGWMLWRVIVPANGTAELTYRLG
jgi:hypothetical protein